ncbi:MAG: 2-C-methyl-D-erythritol 4-phosphate cytidylyltransferase [Armatimonadota bacterium]
MKNKITAIITAAGQSRRMKSSVNKLLIKVKGVPLLAYTIACFQKNKYIDEIIITSSKDSIKKYKEIVKKNKFSKVTKIIQGGATRFKSVYNALKEASGAGYVLIHDGARPLISQEVLNRTILALKKYKAVMAGVAPKDTIKEVNGKLFINKTIDRDKIYLAQTPQAFKTSLILEAYGKAPRAGKGITDDARTAEVLGVKVKIVEGSYENIKITTPEDLIIAEAILRNRGVLCTK